MQREFRELRDRRPGLSPPQFSLRFLLVLTASIATLTVLAIQTGPLVTLAGIIALLSTLAHMASTAIGGQLRDHRPTMRTADTAADDEPRIRQPLKAQPSDFAQRTQLSHRKPLPRRPILWAMGIGAGSFAVLSSIILCVVMWQSLSVINVLFGACSAAMIGGLIGFWLGSLFQVARDALSEAQKET